MSQRFKGFIGQSYTLRNQRYDCQRTVNLFPEVDETGVGKNAEIAQLARTPGLTRVVDTSTSLPAIAGLSLYKASNGIVYLVKANGLYTVDYDSNTSTWSTTKLASFTPVDWAQMTDNTQQLFIVSNGKGWAWDFTSHTLSVVSNGSSGTSLTSPASVTYYDGYVVFTEKDSNQFWWTDLYTATVPGLNFASAETNSDNVVGVFSNNEDLWVFGETTTELWYDAGQGNTVFARRPGILLEVGCAAFKSIAKLDNNRIAWLSKSNRGQVSVVMAEGYSYSRISTFPIDQTLSTVTEDQLAGATAYSYIQDGHTFYVLNVPGLSSTWVYDVTTSLQLQQHTWHERTFTNSLTGVESRHRVQNLVFTKNGFMGVDYENGSIYFLGFDSYTDFGNPIYRQRVFPHVSADGKRVFYQWLAFDFKTGVGLQGKTAPLVILQYSNDGGNTWSNQIERSAGAIGQYHSRVIFNQLGQSRDRVFKLILTDPVDWAVSGCAMEAEVGGH
jgi:hypothetical protein